MPLLYQNKDLEVLDMTQQLQEKPTILLVDDEKANLKILSELLKSDAQIIVAKSGDQAITKAVEMCPDIILLDVIMPDMDGFDVIKVLKSNAATHSIPVIFITGLADANFEEKGLQLGACDYIQKPFHTAIVKARVKLHLQLLKQRQLLEQLALIDPLTTIANRRKYEEVFETEWRNALRQEKTLSLAILDVDFFKQYNDTLGHAAGDHALEKVAINLAHQLQRPKDFVARYGGEEFIILLPDTDSVGAEETVNKCRMAIESLKIPHPTSKTNDVLTISSGGITCKPKTIEGKNEVLNVADNMLYEAKRIGRNKVCWKELPN